MQRIRLLLILLVTVLFGSAQVPFTAGNVVVYRVGDGITPVSVLSNVSYPVFLDEYTPDGTFVQSIAMPVVSSGANHILTHGGNGQTGSWLTLSVNGQYLVLTGYDAAPGTANVANATSALVPRVIGLVKYDGTINTSTALTDYSSEGEPTGAVSTNGTDLWAVGTGFTVFNHSGVRYTTVGSTTSTQLTTVDPRGTHGSLTIAGNELYMSSTFADAGDIRLGKVGTGGLPTTSGQTITGLPGISTNGFPYQFVLADLDAGVAGVDVLYVADETAFALRKYSLVGGNWTLNGTIGVNTDDYRGLTASISGTTVTLYATRKGSGGAAGGRELVKLIDASGYNGDFTGTPDVIATSLAGTYFRGVAMAPYSLLQNQTITFSDITKTYGNADFDPGATASSGLDVTYTSSNPSVAVIVNNQIHIVGAGTSNITASQAGNGSYNAAPNVTKTLTVNKATLTVTADDKTKVEGQPNPALTVSYSGFVYSDDQTAVTTSPTVSTTALVNSPPGNYPITATGAAAANYDFTYVQGTLTITPLVLQDQTISFADMTKTYGDADFDPGATASSGLQVTYSSSNPAVATIVNNKIHITGVGTADITASQSGNGSYNAAPDVVKVLTVNKAALTIRADDKNKAQGQPNPTLTVSYSGFVNGEDQTALSTPPTISTTATISSPVGTYPITASGAVAANYTISYIDGTLSVAANGQTISFADMIKTYGDADFDPGATASSGLAVTYTSSNPSVATIVNNQIHIVGAGTSTITASQAGNGDYGAAADVSKTLTVNKASLTITADDKSKVMNTANPPLTASYSGFVNGETATVLTTQPTLSTTATQSSPPGTYPITASGAASNNYNITYVAGALTVSSLLLQTISFADMTKTYGDADFDPGATASSGLTVSYVSSNPAVATIVGGKIHIVGSGTSQITASQSGNVNYAAATNVAKTLTVNKANLVIKADDKTVQQNHPLPTLTVSYTGFVNGDNANKLTTKPTISTVSTTELPIGTYPITASGAVAANYTITYQEGVLTITAYTVSEDRMSAYFSSGTNLQVNVYASQSRKVALSLLSPSGHVLISKEVILAVGLNTYQLSAIGLAEGPYIVKVAGEGLKLYKNIIKATN